MFLGLKKSYLFLGMLCSQMLNKIFMYLPKFFMDYKCLSYNHKCIERQHS